jgi:hypothetical protein
VPAGCGAPAVIAKGAFMADIKAQQQQECAHPACSCKVPAGTKYCSDYCKKAPETELHCNCMHPGCR